MLRRAGFEVIEASTGAEALRIVAEERPDLVLLDVNLPDLDGFEVCRRIREQLGTLTMPVVHVSSTFVHERAQELSIEGGSDAYLTEPIEASVLLATVRPSSGCVARRRGSGPRAGAGRPPSTPSAAVCASSPPRESSSSATRHSPRSGARPGRRAGRRAVGRNLAPGGSARRGIAREPAAASGTRQSIELERGGRWFRVLVEPVREGDVVAGFVSTVADITVERQVAEARAALLAREQMARADAEAANRAKDEFLAMLGHELRNPLDVIASAVNVLDAISSQETPAVRTREVIHRQVDSSGTSSTTSSTSVGSAPARSA